jgi:hypothetical protein
VGEGEREGLRSVLDDGAAFATSIRQNDPDAPVFVVLALQRRWFAQDREALVDAIAASDVPVAIIPADRNDPFESFTAVRGLIEFVRAVGSRRAVLRSDVAAIGALAHGAALGAIGTHPSVRHTVPPGMSGGGVPDDRTPSVFVACRICDGRTLSRFQDSRFDREAWAVEETAFALQLPQFGALEITEKPYFHSAIAWRSVLDSVLATEASRRGEAWAQMCGLAVERHDELLDRGVYLAPPDSLPWLGRLFLVSPLG